MNGAGFLFYDKHNTQSKGTKCKILLLQSLPFTPKCYFQGLWAPFFFFLIKNDFQKQTKSENKKQEGDSIGKIIVCIIIKALLFLLSSRLLFSSSRLMTLPVTGIWSLLGPISPVAFLPYRTMLMPSAFAP
jgi:hypothetical protein